MATCTLIDGTVVPSDSEAWRHETEARHVLTLPQNDRRPYLEDIAQRRGKDAAERLERTIREIWMLR